VEQTKNPSNTTPNGRLQDYTFWTAAGVAIEFISTAVSGLGLAISFRFFLIF